MNTEKSTGIAGHISSATRIRRIIATSMTRPFFRYKLDETIHTVGDIREAFQRGGVIFVTNHFGNGDFPRVVEVINRIEPNAKIEIPIAGHQLFVGLKQFGQAIGIGLHRIVTERTLRKRQQKEKNKKKAKSHREQLLEQQTLADSYLTDLAQTVQNRGAGAVSPQATREKELHDWKRKPIARTNEELQKRGAQNFTWVVLGLKLGEHTDYGKRRGLNIGRRYTVVIGNMLTNQELIQLAQVRKKSLDETMKELMEKVVAQSYKSKPEA